MLKQIMLDEKNFLELVAGEFIGQRGDAFADYQAGERTAGLLGDLLRGGERLEAGLIPFAFALLGDEKNLHSRLSCSLL